MSYNRDSVIKYRDKHPEKWQIQNKKNQRAYDLRNRDKLLEKMKQRKLLKKIENILQTPPIEVN